MRPYVVTPYVRLTAGKLIKQLPQEVYIIWYSGNYNEVKPYADLVLRYVNTQTRNYVSHYIYRTILYFK